MNQIALKWVITQAASFADDLVFGERVNAPPAMNGIRCKLIDESIATGASYLG
jgi:fructose-specific component phosphotransferase system IIB-like protein